MPISSLVSYEPIEIAGPFGPMKTQGYRLRELAAHHTLSDKTYWTVSHLPSGLSFGFRFQFLYQALNAMRALLLLRASWRCTPQDVEATPGVYETLVAHKGQRYQLSTRGNVQKGMNGYGP